MNSKRPYIVQDVTLVTYSGRRISLSLVEYKIIDVPVRLVKEKIFDSFSAMVDKPVDVELKVRYI